MLQLIFASRPTKYDDQVLKAVRNSVVKNRNEGSVTGSLISRDDLFLYMLEGPERAVITTYNRIVAGRRHADVRLVSCKSCHADERLFSGWSIVEDSEQSWVWSRGEVADGALRSADAADAVWMFERLASLTDRGVHVLEPSARVHTCAEAQHRPADVRSASLEICH
jgi:Sensors of blue-light using FAD